MNDDQKPYPKEVKRRQLVRNVNNKITLYQNRAMGVTSARLPNIALRWASSILGDFLTTLAEIGGRLLGAQTPGEIAAGLEFSKDVKKHIGP